ncbi:macrolide efflux ABC transporter membrane-spanning permease [Streptococcus pneumoniae]|nr:macrolide efflux ABC transporter membrane-spanning permease [Streptococcus pneumoniae]
MNRYAVQLISRGAINKMGNMLYDYGNSVWLASMGTIGQTVLGMYQISELVTSILVNPFGGVISDRFSRRKIFNDGRSCLWDSLSGYFFHKE